MSARIIPFPGRPNPDRPEPVEHEPMDGDAYDGPDLVIDPTATRCTLTEVAWLLDLSTAVTEEYLANGTIPGSLIDGEWTVSRARLRAWVDSLPREGGAW